MHKSVYITLRIRKEVGGGEKFIVLIPQKTNSKKEARMGRLLLMIGKYGTAKMMIMMIRKYVTLTEFIVVRLGGSAIVSWWCRLHFMCWFGRRPLHSFQLLLLRPNGTSSMEASAQTVSFEYNWMDLIFHT